AFFHLISECKPGVIFGEQVASKDGLGWLDLVQTDLETENYAVGAVDLCAAGFGAPHIRQRLFWVADTFGGKRARSWNKRQAGRNEYSNGRAAGRLDNSERLGWRTGRNWNNAGNDGQQLDAAVKNDTASPTNGYWRDADWLLCRDDKWRPVESGTFPLADGIAGRVGKLRAYGNAIAAPVAEEFIRAYMLITED
ncbi:DNA cytosine methyltransferase, partial [Morganella morganii]